MALEIQPTVLDPAARDHIAAIKVFKAVYGQYISHPHLDLDPSVRTVHLWFYCAKSPDSNRNYSVRITSNDGSQRLLVNDAEVSVVKEQYRPG